MHSEKLHVAEHLLTQTYPALKDPKLLISILQNIQGAIEETITKKLEEARNNHEIPPYNTTFNGKLNAFKLHLAKKLGINPVDFMMIAEVQELLHEHETSPMEFRRKEGLVIADEQYKLHNITEEKTKTFLTRTKSLISRL